MTNTAGRLQAHSLFTGFVAGALGGMVGVVVAHWLHHATTGSSAPPRSLDVSLGLGVLSGGAYGVLAGFVPGLTTGFGTAFGSSLGLGATDALLPPLVTGTTRMDSPLLLGTTRLLAHAVYGGTTEAIRRALV